MKLLSGQSPKSFIFTGGKGKGKKKVDLLKQTEFKHLSGGGTGDGPLCTVQQPCLGNWLREQNAEYQTNLNKPGEVTLPPSSPFLRGRNRSRGAGSFLFYSLSDKRSHWATPHR